MPRRILSLPILIITAEGPCSSGALGRRVSVGLSVWLRQEACMDDLCPHLSVLVGSGMLPVQASQASPAGRHGAMGAWDSR